MNHLYKNTKIIGLLFSVAIFGSLARADFQKFEGDLKVKEDGYFECRQIPQVLALMSNSNVSIQGKIIKLKIHHDFNITGKLLRFGSLGFADMLCASIACDESDYDPSGISSVSGCIIHITVIPLNSNSNNYAATTNPVPSGSCVPTITALNPLRLLPQNKIVSQFGCDSQGEIQGQFNFSGLDR